ncbi:hypothetical protein INR49_016054 [Caranx melampygus]|nr:hypothetical protein INR49_016054 [Caranx melampygus]
MTTRNISRFWEWGRKIICVGRNYADHAKELKNAIPTEPVLFLKPPSAYVREGSPILVPLYTSNLHHEVELGVVIGKGGTAIPQSAAMEHVAGYALCLDMTARDVQDELKSKGLPWTLAKAFNTSCPVSEFIPRERIPDPSNVKLWLKVNDQLRQSGCTSQMIFSIPYLISYISDFITLEEGDLILTGTPKGVSAVQEHDELQAGIEDIVTMNFRTQEVLNPAHLPSWIRHQPLTANKQKMRQGEVLEPVLQMFGIEADAYGAPRGVNKTCGGVFQGQALEGWKAWVLGECLGVVGYSPRHRIPDHHNELGLAVHSADPARSLLCDEVAGGLLHGDLAIQCPRHQTPGRKEENDFQTPFFLQEHYPHLPYGFPKQTKQTKVGRKCDQDGKMLSSANVRPFIIKPVEEVRLRTDRSHIRVDAEKLQQRAGPSFLHADYNRLRKPLGPESVGHGDAVALGALLGAVRQYVLKQLSGRVHLLCVCAVPLRRRVLRWSQVAQNAATIVQNVIVSV